MADEADAAASTAATTTGGEMVDYTVPVAPGMVVLDAIHAVQAPHAPDLAVRWNCKAGKCGSCGGEVNGKPRADVHGPHRQVSGGRADRRAADEGVSGDQGPGLRRVVEFSRSTRRFRRSSCAHGRRAASFRRTKPTACRSSASASSASCARTSAMCCASTTSRRRSAGRGSSSAWRGWRCIRWTTENRLGTAERSSWGSASATSPSAARRSVRRASRSRTMRSFR